MLNQTGNPDIQEALVILHEMSADERVREEARMRMKTILDENTRIESALRKGRSEGKAEGRAEGKTEGRSEERAMMINAMRATGLSEDQITLVLKNRGDI